MCEHDDEVFVWQHPYSLIEAEVFLKATWWLIFLKLRKVSAQLLSENRDWGRAPPPNLL